MKNDEEIKFEITEHRCDDQEYSDAAGTKSGTELPEQEKEAPWYEELISRQTKRNDHFVDYSGGLMGI
jgi:hypothetical protein